MLQLNALIEQNTPQMIEQQLIKQYLAFATQNDVSQYTAHQSLVWVLKLMRFHNGIHPGELNQYDVETFLSALAIEQHVSNNTQQLALSAISSFYREFIRIDLPLKHFIKSKSRRGFSDRFSASLCQSIIQNLTGPSQLMAKLAYHCQLRLYQVANLKTSDIDLKSGTLSVFDKSSTLKFKAIIPLSLQLDLRIQKMRANQINKEITRKTNKHSATNKSKPTQTKLFRDNNCLLFILTDFKNTLDLKKSNQITPETQLAILKSEINLIINRIQLLTPSTQEVKSNKKGFTALELSKKHHKPIASQFNKPNLFKLANKVKVDGQLHLSQSSKYSKDPAPNLQKDFFDLGAA